MQFHQNLFRIASRVWAEMIRPVASLHSRPIIEAFFVLYVYGLK